MAENEETAEEEGGSKKKKLPIIPIAAVVLLIVNGIGAFLFLSEPSKKKRDVFIVPGLQSNGTGEQKPLNEPKYSPIYSFETHIGKGKNLHLLVMKFSIVAEEQKALEYLEARKPLIQDYVFFTLRNMTKEDLKSTVGVNRLKKTLLDKLNSLYTHEYINDSESKDDHPIKRILIQDMLIL